MLQAGTMLGGRYRCLEALGEQGHFTIWLAEDTRQDGQVIVKLLPARLAEDATEAEAFLAALLPYRNLKHDHIVPILDVIKETGLVAVVMPDILGKTLLQHLQEKPEKAFHPPEIKSWVRGICDALQYAHEKNHLAHLDLQTSRIIVDEKGKVLVVDFGLARLVSDWAHRHGGEQDAQDLMYRSPQSLAGLPGPSDDIYSLGVILFELLTGQLPFNSQNVARQIRDVVPPALNVARAGVGSGLPPVPTRWETTIAKCLDKKAEMRPRSAHELAGMLGLTAMPAEKRQHHHSLLTLRGWKLYAAVAALFLFICGGLTGLYLAVIKPRMDAKAAEAARIAEEQRRAQEVEEQKRRAEQEAADLARQAAEAAEKARLEQLERERQEADRLARARGVVRISSVPPGATVTVAGRTGTTPAEIPDVPIGPQVVLVERAGYRPVRVEAVISENQTWDGGVVEMVQQKGSVQITSVPSGALVYSKGNNLGATPLSLTDWPAGRHLFELHHAGFYPVTMESVVQDGQEARINARLAPAPGPRPGTNFTNGRRMAMVWVPPLNGWASQTEVTQEQFLDVMRSNPSVFPGARRPVDNVTWEEAVEFCRRLTAAERSRGAIPVSLSYRLPTEKEWEALAADAPMPGTGPGGGPGTLEANRGPQNRFGLFFVRGNVWEWCADAYNLDEALRVLRGGSWMHHGQGSSAPDRDFNGVEDRGNHRGFRCVLKYQLPD